MMAVIAVGILIFCDHREQNFSAIIGGARSFGVSKT